MNSGTPTHAKEEKDKKPYVQLSCSFCKQKKRKCDGETPCSTCKKYNQTCIYYADKDRRRRKYHTDYINYLESKSDVLQKFIKEFVRDDPKLSALANERLGDALKKSYQQVQEQMNNNEKLFIDNGDGGDFNNRDHDVVGDFEDENFQDLLKSAKRLQLDDYDRDISTNAPEIASGVATQAFGAAGISGKNFNNREYTEQSESPFSQGTSSTVTDFEDIYNSFNDPNNPLIMNGLNINFKNSSFKEHLIDCFEENFGQYFFSLMITLPSIRQWEFPSEIPSKQLLMCSIFTIGTVYSKNPYATQTRKVFAAEAEGIAIGACRHPLDIYLIQGLLLLSCYEMGMGSDSVSYLFDSMACSLTQHMGLHISYDHENDSKRLMYAPKNSPMRSANLWSVCLQDRIITNVINVPCCIHFKRIIAPPYTTILDPEHENYLSELCFSYQTRLWYIFDRFMDQIYSVDGDIGDTNQRNKLAEAGLNALKEMKTSLPSRLVLSEDNENDFNTDKLVLVFHYSYYCCIFQFYNLCLTAKATKSTKFSIEAALSATSLLKKIGEYRLYESMPYFMGYLVYSNALVHLFVLINQQRKLISAHHGEIFSKFYSNFLVCVNALSEMSQMWKRCSKHLEVLASLSEQHGFNCPELIMLVFGNEPNSDRFPTSTEANPIADNIHRTTANDLSFSNVINQTKDEHPNIQPMVGQGIEHMNEARFFPNNTQIPQMNNNSFYATPNDVISDIFQSGNTNNNNNVDFLAQLESFSNSNGSSSFFDSNMMFKDLENILRESAFNFNANNNNDNSDNSNN
ncbi:hypothetical protein PACTADRAFT_49643 [Pachysolen tannophilus NRRL Y-2460]|uniref:Zn(2)-C6 fungal-type domain-containing protein n=1 Tax=Pachysolen tannophilus NRRL Y-2460 TaxID=669874 RepID=A0A1E4TWX8_PACTA|nr:hypothetical protein PACTADRAFT_49643 [Pachysolen tannophilus NRRL Y-2460]